MSKIEIIKELIRGEDSDLIQVIKTINNDPLYSGPNLPTRGKKIDLGRSLLSVNKAILISAIESLDSEDEDGEDSDIETDSNPRKSVLLRGQSHRAIDVIEVEAEEEDDDESEDEDEDVYEEEETEESEEEDEYESEDEDESRTRRKR